MFKDLLERPAVKYGLLTGAVIFVVKAAIYASGNIAFRFNPVYTLGTAMLVLLSLTLVFRERVDIKLGNYLLSGMILVLITFTLSATCDQLFYKINPDIPNEISAIRLQQVEEFEESFESPVLDEFKEELKKSNLEDVGLVPYLQYIFNTSAVNFICVFGVALYFWLRARRARDFVGRRDS